MIVSEKTAAEKACPEALQITSFVETPRCVGSGCMAWVWSKDQPKLGYCGKVRGQQ